MRRTAMSGWAGIHALWIFAILCSCLSVPGGGSPANSSPVPGRIVTQYALTSTHDLSYYDPRDWRLLGSTNDGKTWTTLDVQTNQFFGKRNQRRTFDVTNHTAYNVYRLKVDRVNAELDDPSPEQWQAQLAELELVGPIVGASSEAELGTLITSSWSHPLIGPPENAFDNDLSTRWVDFGPTLPSGCWIQCQYVPRSELTLLVTNISQLAVRARLAATHDLLLEKGPHILAELNSRDSKTRTLTGYALTSANDVPQRDPSDWRLLGSSDNGRTWSVLDVRSGERFATRFQKRVFALAKPARFGTYRLEIDKVVSDGGLALQVGEIEPIYAAAAGESQFSLVVSAKTENPPAEASDMAFDGDPKTKWLSFAIPSTNDPCWIQWQSIPYEDGLPIVNLHHLTPLLESAAAPGGLLSELVNPTNIRTRAITGYALTTALDAPNRDPRDWRLLGSTNAGKTWNTLDARTNEFFTARAQQRSFHLAKTEAYPLYCLQIASVANPALADGVQLAEIEPIFETTNRDLSCVTLVSAAGDFGLREAGVKAFDGDPHTKWYENVKFSTNRDAWIQWRYSAAHDPENPGQRAFDLDRLEYEVSSRQLTSIRPVRLDLVGVVASRNSNSSILGLLDDTGFQLFRVDASLEKAGIGDWVRLRGLVRFTGDLPEVRNAGLTATGYIPAVGKVDSEQRFDDDQQFLAGSAEGTVAAISQGQYYTTIRLLGDEGMAGLRLRIFDPGNTPFLGLTGHRLAAKGVIAPVFDDKGRRVAGTIWVASPADLSLAPMTEVEWSRGWFNKISEVVATNSRLSGFVRLRGTKLRENRDGSFALSDGTNWIAVRGNQSAAIANGSRVEVAGILNREGAAPFVQFASAHEAHAETAVALHAPRAQPIERQGLVTDIRQVNDLIRNSPQKNFRVKLRGVVTYIDLGLSSFYLQDGPDGIMVDGSLKAGLYPLLGQEGTYIELQGAVKDGSLTCTAPITVLGKGRIPTPLQHSWDYLMTGRDDGLWVQVEGVVTAFEKQRLTLTVAGGQIIVWINQIDHDVQNRLLGGVVRVSGICAPVVNGRNQRLGLRLLVPSGEYVELVTAPPSNPFDLASVPIGSVMQLNSAEGSLLGQLVKTKGVVTFKAPGMVFLQDGGEGIRVSLREPSPVEVGDQVEAVGLPQPDGFSPQLTKGLLRKIDHLPLPAPKALDLFEVSQDETVGGMDATRASLEATFIGTSPNESLRVLLFRTDKTDKTFSVFMPPGDDSSADISPGSRVRLEGVFKAKVDSAPDFGQVISSFEMFVNSPSDLTVLARPPWWTLTHTLGLLGGLACILLISLAWAGALHRKVAQRTRELREEIDERKRVQAEADKAHSDLLVAARQAGMAEVAIGVLHNVGNVLNSVNVSSALVVDKLRQLKLGGLTKAIALLRQNQDNLGAFLTKDEKGARIMPYLEKLADHVETEQAGALEELENLTRNIEHIKDIVTVQQNYASYSGLTETLQVVDLVEDALRMNASSLERHAVHIRREYDSGLPTINADKHKIIQILVNIIRNAEQACDEAGRADKEIVIRVLNGDGFILVSTIDNGIGIAPENINRIFNHGFTTRKNGHGFGLHTSALAAKEMGGVLRFSSAGLGKGATFTLELPVAGSQAKTAKAAA